MQRRNFLKVSGGSGLVLLGTLGTYCGVKLAHAEDYILDPGEFTHRHQRITIHDSSYHLLDFILTIPRPNARRDYTLRYEIGLSDPVIEAGERLIGDPPPRIIYTPPVRITSFDEYTTLERVPYQIECEDGTVVTRRLTQDSITPLFRNPREARGVCIYSAHIQTQMRTESDPIYRGLKISIGSSRR